MLGMTWQTKSDKMTFPPSKDKQQTNMHTKRDIVKFASGIFDPLGLISQIHIKAKIIVQKLWTTELGWDEPLSTELAEECVKIETDLDQQDKQQY